jgi:hypothetical protein
MMYLDEIKPPEIAGQISSPETFIPILLADELFHNYTDNGPIPPPRRSRREYSPRPFAESPHLDASKVQICLEERTHTPLSQHITQPPPFRYRQPFVFWLPLPPLFKCPI